MRQGMRGSMWLLARVKCRDWSRTLAYSPCDGHTSTGVTEHEPFAFCHTCACRLGGRCGSTAREPRDGHGGRIGEEVCGLGGTNRSDKGLNLSGSWQQGHSATYNTPSRI